MRWIERKDDAMMIIEFPRMGTGIRSVFNGGPMSVVPVSGRLNVGARNIEKVVQMVQKHVEEKAASDEKAERRDKPVDKVDVKV